MSTDEGHGAITADGCPVEVYRHLVDRGEAEFISRAIHPQASVLDLGTGTGRIANALVALGHPVVAVDNSAEMLAEVHGAEPVLADIETYRAPRRFDAVLLASHLVNTPRNEVRRALLATVSCHLAPGGKAFIEWHPPRWFDALIPGQTYGGTVGTVSSTLHVTSVDDDLLIATVTYTIGDDEWSQPFTARRLTAADLVADLSAVGLALISQEPDDDWVLASTQSS